MNIGNIVITGILLAASAGIVFQIKEVPKLIYNKIKQRIIYTVRIYQYDPLFSMLENWLFENHSSSYRDVEASLHCDQPSYPNQEPEITSLKYLQEDNTFVINYLGKRILVNKNKEKLDKAQGLKDLYFRKFVLSGIMAKKEIDVLLREAISLSENKKQKNTIKISSNSSYGDWSVARELKIKPLQNTILPEGYKDSIMKDIDSFVQAEQWCDDVCIPYKRGYCFYGPPGTGKTTLALAIANYTKRPIYCLNLNCIEDDSRLPFCFSNLPNNSILLIEDIDKVFSGRENVKEGSKITFSSLLNCLDGAFYRQGLIVIITTNHYDKLDEALLRTGRIDLQMEIPKPTHTEISSYLTTFYNKDIKIQGNFNLKMSDIQEICIKNKTLPEMAKHELKKLRQ